MAAPSAAPSPSASRSEDKTQAWDDKCTWQAATAAPSALSLRRRTSLLELWTALTFSAPPPNRALTRTPLYIHVTRVKSLSVCAPLVSY